MVQIIHISMFVAVLIYAGILYWWSIDLSDDIVFAESTLNQLSIALGFLGIICFVCAFLLPARMIKIAPQQHAQSRWEKSYPASMSPAESACLTFHILRLALIEGVAIFGLVLGILGVDWQITLPFFVASTAVLALTFPTEERWQQTLDKFNENNPPGTYV